MVNLVQLRKLLRQLILVLGFKAEIYENISEKWERIFGSPGNLASIGNRFKNFDPKNFIQKIFIQKFSFKI